MLVSIITVSFNAASTIRETIASVLSQRNIDLEYIVIDGASTDGTVDMIRSYGPQIAHFLSEPDLGIYDAMNKGIDIASGDIIGILNADDTYAAPDVLASVVAAFNPDVDAVYANLVYVDQKATDIVRRTWLSGEYTDGAFDRGWMPPHPTFFARREVYEKYGYYSLKLKSAADYEFMLRVVHRHKIQLAYLNRIIIRMRVGGKSNVTIKNRLIANREDRMAWKMNGIKPGLLTLIRKPLSKLGQFFGR